MVQFKALIILIVAITSPINKIAYSFQEDLSKNELIVFSNSSATLTLKKGEYEIKSNITGFDLQILNEKKRTKIFLLQNPRVRFYLKKINATAKGLFIFSSSLPEKAEYYFSVDKNERIMKIKGDWIQFKKVDQNMR